MTPSSDDVTYYTVIIISHNFIIRLCILQMNASALVYGEGDSEGTCN